MGATARTDGAVHRVVVGSLSTGKVQLTLHAQLHCLQLQQARDQCLLSGGAGKGGGRAGGRRRGRACLARPHTYIVSASPASTAAAKVE